MIPRIWSSGKTRHTLPRAWSRRIPVLLLVHAISFLVTALSFGAWLRPPLDENNALKAKVDLALRYPEARSSLINALSSFIRMRRRNLTDQSAR